MAGKKGARKSATKPMTTESFGKSTGGHEVESPVANTGPVPVYRLDMGESLPPQADAVKPAK